MANLIITIKDVNFYLARFFDGYKHLSILMVRYASDKYYDRIRVIRWMNCDALIPAAVQSPLFVVDKWKKALLKFLSSFRYIFFIRNEFTILVGKTFGCDGNLFFGVCVIFVEIANFIVALNCGNTNLFVDALYACFMQRRLNFFALICQVNKLLMRSRRHQIKNLFFPRTVLDNVIK